MHVKRKRETNGKFLLSVVNSLKPVSVKTNSGQMHLSAADHVGAAVLSNVVYST